MRNIMTTKSNGFTLLEVMIALLISAVSLLGLASLQAQSLSFNNSAFIRSQATYLAYDIFDKMRMNRNAANNGSYDIGLNDVPPSASCYGAAANCSEIDFAGADKYEWYKEVSTTLPGGKSSVSRATGTGQTIISVTVQWNKVIPSYPADTTSEIVIRGEL